MAKRKNILVQGREIRLLDIDKTKYASLTDIAKHFVKRTDKKISDWIEQKHTIEFLSVWEKIHNPNFDELVAHELWNQAGANVFSLSPQQWIKKTNAIGIQSKSGRYGGTYAHEDISIQFCSWLSPTFQVHLIKKFQQLKKLEADVKGESLAWNLKRVMSKINYNILTDTIKEHLIPKRLELKKQGFIYANEADLLNIAVFGMTAKQWRMENPKAKGNIRDNATIEQLLILANIESINSRLIKMGFSHDERLALLNETAIDQMQSLLSAASLSQLKKLNN